MLALRLNHVSQYLCLFASLVPGCLASWARAEQNGQPPSRIDFDRDVRPIFVASCVECHGEKKRKGGLRLDVKAAAMQGGRGGRVVVPGQPNQSALIERVLGLGDEQRMPLDRDPLPESAVQVLTRWIEEGASWPDDGLHADHGVEERHWSYVPPTRVPPPQVKNADWCRNEVDRFILHELEGHGLQPAASAGRAALCRRITLDLTGLPPSSDALDAFLADTRPDAYERLVDRLLASPHYGERWARPWLDLARHADSHGYEKDGGRTVWPYRDWVIDALNADMPFDRFTIEQLAGDLLPNPTRDQVIATGFSRNTMINEEGGTDAEEYRVNAVIDRVNTTATVWLGSTLACAQCHDHKFDPFTQRDYYSMFAFFNSTAAESVFGAGSSFNEISAKVELPSPESDLWHRRERALVALLNAIGDKAPESSDAKLQLSVLREGRPRTDTTLVMRELEAPRASHILERGSFLSPAERVEPAVPSFLGLLPSDEPRNRLGLARWLTSAGNPLAARAAVNRMWEQHFGRGLVETSEDFGTRGTPPTNPGLLDWLATEFISRGWSQKQLHRLMVTSATYRQSSRVTPELLERDPSNALLARGARFRLDAETIRDQALAVGGLLNLRMGGPPVFPEQPPGVWSNPYSDNRWQQSVGDDRYRRSIYTYWKRSSPYPSFVTFDAPNRQVACTRRARTNTPLQALTTLNDPVYVQAAVGLARRVVRECDSTDDRLTLAMKFALSREPEPEERERLKGLVAQQRERFRRDAASTRRLLAILRPSGESEDPELAAWTIVANVLLNLDEVLNHE